MTTSHPIAVLAPTRGELLPTVRRLKLTAEGPVYRGTIGSTHLLAAATGIGHDRTRQAIEQLLRHQPFQALLLIGFAGALDPTLTTGQVVMVTGTVHPTGNRHTLQSLAAAPKLASATALTLDHVVETPTQKSDLRRRFPDTHIVDMESDYLAAFAAERELPLAILRAISDPADAALPAGLLHCVNADGAINITGVIRLLLRDLPRHPLRLPAKLAAMVRLGAASHAAAANLAAAVAQVLPAIADALPQDHTPHASP